MTTLKVLVTGGTGFVGSWTAKAVQDAGHQVRFLVRSPEELATSAAILGQAAELCLDPAVDVSSLAAVFDRDLVRRTGDLPVADGLDDYGASKALVEESVRGLQDDGAPIHITYPGTPMTGAAMEYYTRMPESDNEPLESRLGVTFRDPYVTLADSVDRLRAAGLL